MVWTEATQAVDRGHLCEPVAENDGTRLVFFSCRHCGQSWILDHDTSEWSQVDG